MSIFSQSPMTAIAQATHAGGVQITALPAAPARHWGRSTFWLAFWLAVVLIASKAVLLGAPADASWDALADYQRALAIAGHQDVLFATAFGLVGQAALLATRSWRRTNLAVWVSLLALGVVFAFYGIGSIW